MPHVDGGDGVAVPEDGCPIKVWLDQEERLYDLQATIIALDLIASGNLRQGIEGDDMPGLKVVARQARTLVEGVRKAWSEAISRGRSDG